MEIYQLLYAFGVQVCFLQLQFFIIIKNLFHEMFDVLIIIIETKLLPNAWHRGWHVSRKYGF